jgi:hypothetical protein
MRRIGFVTAAFLVLLIGSLAAQGKTASGSIALDQNSPALGTTVTFTTSVSGLPGWATPRIQIICEQDGAIVYGEAGPASQGFLLGGAGSEWLRAGGPASCVATLYYWQFHPRQVFHPLASLSFEAAGQ